MLDPVAVPDLPVDAAPIPPLPEAFPAPAIECVSVDWSVEARTLPRFDRPLEVSVRQASLLTGAPWVRGLGKLPMEVNTQGWRFPLPPDAQAPSAAGCPQAQSPAGVPTAPSQGGVGTKRGLGRGGIGNSRRSSFPSRRRAPRRRRSNGP